MVINYLKMLYIHIGGNMAKTKIRNKEDFIKRWMSYDTDDFSEPICNEFEHKTKGKETCKAYPEKIPSEILTNEVDHTKSYIADNGIVFKKKS